MNSLPVISYVLFDRAPFDLADDGDPETSFVTETEWINNPKIVRVCPKPPPFQDSRLRFPPRLRNRRRLRCRDPGRIALSGRRIAMSGMEFAPLGDTGARAAVLAPGGGRIYLSTGSRCADGALVWASC